MDGGNASKEPDLYNEILYRNNPNKPINKYIKH